MSDQNLTPDEVQLMGLSDEDLDEVAGGLAETTIIRETVIIKDPR